MRGIGSAIWYGLPPVSAAVGIFWLSSQSGADVEATGASGILGSYTGEIVHALEYALLGALICRAVVAWRGRRAGARATPTQPLVSVAIAVALSLAYALSDEFHQSFVPGRASEARDLLLDTIGAVVGTTGYAMVQKRLGSLFGD